METLREMFPDKDGEQIKLALRQAEHDVRVAVNKLIFGVTKRVIIHVPIESK